MKWIAIVLISAWCIGLVWLGYHVIKYRNQNED